MMALNGARRRFDGTARCLLLAPAVQRCPLTRRLVGVKRKCCKRHEFDAPDPERSWEAFTRLAAYCPWLLTARMEACYHSSIA